METWIIFALIAPALWAVTNLFDSKLRNFHIKDEFVLTTFAGFVGLLAFLFVPIYGFSFPGIWIFTVSMIAGVLYIYTMIPYFKALSLEDTSTVIMLWYITPFLIPFFARFFLNENLLFIQYVGFALILLGGLLISTKRNALKKIHISKALFMMLASGIMLDVYYLLEKYVYQNQPFWNGFMWIRLGSFIGALTILTIPKYRKSFIQMKNNLNFKSFGLIFGGELLNLIALVSIGFALSLGSVSLVTSLTNFQPLFLLAYVILLSKFFPRLYQEKLSKKIIFVKVIAVALLIFGLYLIGI